MRRPRAGRDGRAPAEASVTPRRTAAAGTSGLDITSAPAPAPGSTLLSAFDHALQRAGRRATSTWSRSPRSSRRAAGSATSTRRWPAATATCCSACARRPSPTSPATPPGPGLGWLDRRDRRRPVRRAPRRQRGVGRWSRSSCSLADMNASARRRLRPGADGPGLGPVRRPPGLRAGPRGVPGLVLVRRRAAARGGATGEQRRGRDAPGGVTEPGSVRLARARLDRGRDRPERPHDLARRRCARSARRGRRADAVRAAAAGTVAQ